MLLHHFNENIYIKNYNITNAYLLFDNKYDCRRNVRETKNLLNT